MSQLRRLLQTIVLLTIIAAVSACGGSNGRNNGVSKDAIADTLVGFTEAFANADTERLASYWSASCSTTDRLKAAAASRSANALFQQLFGEGEYRLTIDPDTLVVEIIDDQHVTVPLDQSARALTATFGVTILPNEDGDALVTKVPISLAREDGQWRVATCDVLGTEDEEEDTPSEST